MKICTKCDISQPFENFSLRNGNKGTRHQWCKKCFSIYKKDHRAKNHEKILAFDRKRTSTEKDKERRRKSRKIYRENNREFLTELHKNYMKDPDHKLASGIRIRFNRALNGNYKTGSAVADLGISISEYKVFLSEQFYDCPKDYELLKKGEKMTWDNHTTNGWHIDHIIPLCSVDLTDREQLLKVCHYTNTRPLWYFENLKKVPKDKQMKKINNLKGKDNV